MANARVPMVGLPYLWWKGAVVRFPGGRLVLDPVERVERTLGQIPLLAWAWHRVSEIEDGGWRLIRGRLLQVEGAVPAPISAVVPVRPATPALNGSRAPAEAFASLLHKSESQSPAAARSAAVLRVIDRLVPDEARILIAIAGGAEPAVLQAHDGGQHIVRNQSNAGRLAKVHAQDLTTVYVTHLLDLELVELVPYEGRSLYEWELLEAETPVRTVLGRYDHRKLIKPKLSRQTLKLSAMGRAFCDACIPVT